MTHAYRLPRAIADRLTTALQGRKNAPAALALAEWLARFWSAPRRLLYSFPVDRRAIAGREDLGLSEARVRGAIAALVEVGFVTRYEPDPGKRYQRTEGGLQRRPILFRFGEEYGVEFAKANARAQAARGAPAPARRVVAPPQSFSVALLRPAPPGARERNLDGRPSRRSAGSGGPMPVLASPGATAAHVLLAQKQSPSGSGFLMGEERQPDPTSPLEMALERLRRGVRA